MKIKIDVEKIKELMGKSRYTFSDGWFFPSDLIPHSSSLKYACKKLYEDGKLERQGSKGDRWGYQYKIKNIAP